MARVLADFPLEVETAGVKRKVRIEKERSPTEQQNRKQLSAAWRAINSEELVSEAQVERDWPTFSPPIFPMKYSTIKY